MSMAAHLEALRPVLTSYFESVSSGTSEYAGRLLVSQGLTAAYSAGQIQLLGDELKKASQMLVSRLLSDWNDLTGGINCLPDEVLALCFTFLPFRGRVFASHVSRHWRSISLNNPEIWAYIGSDLPSRHRPELFTMALERTGTHPVDVFECPDQHDGVEGLLVDHMHHIRSLYYPRVLHSAPLSCPAPHLETLVCNARAPLTIAADFLGGTVGRLRKLKLRIVSFPETCLALSTVTELSLKGPTNAHYGTHFNLLFQLFPMLQSLRLTSLKRGVSTVLPAGPLPALLRSLHLSSSDPDYDLSQLYATWRSDALSYIEIAHNAALSKHVVHSVAGAHTIDVQYDAGYETSTITAAGPGSRFRSLEYWEDKADQRDLAAHLLDIPSALRSVRAMSVPASSLATLLTVFAVLPELTRITLTIDAPDAPAAESCWDVLEPLARLMHRGNLQSLVLHVDYVGAPRGPSAHDAEGLLAQLATLAHVPLPDITVTGLPPVILPDVALAAFFALSVVFVSTEEPARAQA